VECAQRVGGKFDKNMRKIQNKLGAQWKSCACSCHTQKFVFICIWLLCFSKWKFEILAADAVAGAILTVTAHFLFFHFHLPPTSCSCPSVSAAFPFVCQLVCLFVCFRNLFTVASSDFQLLDFNTFEVVAH